MPRVEWLVTFISHCIYIYKTHGIYSMYFYLHFSSDKNNKDESNDHCSSNRAVEFLLSFLVSLNPFDDLIKVEIGKRASEILIAR